MFASVFAKITAFFMTFAIVSALTSFISVYTKGSSISLTDVIISAGCFVLSIVLLFSKKHMCEELASSRVASFFLFKMLGVRREKVEITSEKETKAFAGIIFGLIFGVATYFVSTPLVLLALAGIIAAYVLLVMPEIGVISIFFAIPFLGFLPHPSFLVLGLVIFVSFSTFIKLIRGKRSIKMELVDWSVLAFMVVMLGGGIVSVDFSSSLYYSGMFVALMLGYFLVTTLIRSEIMVRRCVGSIIISSVGVGLLGIYQKISGQTLIYWTDVEMFGEGGGRVTSTFENPNVLGEYLIMCIPIAIALFLVYKGFGKRIGSLATIVALVLALVFSMSRGAWLGCMIALLIFMIIYSRKTLVAFLFGLLLLPFAPIVIPDSVMQRFTSIGNMNDSSTFYRVKIWEGCLEMIRDHWAHGIGVGKEAFLKIYPIYARSAISAPHAHNLYMQITIETGIVGLVLFVAFIFILIQNAFSFYHLCGRYSKECKRLKLYSGAALCGVISILIQGMTDYVWFNYRVFLMFWMLAGLAVAAARSGKQLYSESSSNNY